MIVNPVIVVERVVGNREPIGMQLLDMTGEIIDLTGLNIV